MTRFPLTLALAAASLGAGAQSPTDAPPAPLPEVVARLGQTLETARRAAELMRVAEQVAEVSAAMAPGDAILLLPTPDGVRAVPVTDEPLTEDAALIVHDDGTWSLRALSPGDVPSAEAARPFPTLTLPTAPRVPTGRRFGESADRLTGAVTFDVSGRVEGDATSFLVELSEAQALESLSSTSSASGTRVEARFEFASMAEWAAWRARPETGALLAALASGPLGTETRLTKRR